MKLIFKTFYLFCCLSIAASIQAASDLPIYRAHGSVKNQSDTERNIAASLHLGEIIVRVSGRRDALMNPVVQQSISKASSYLFSFSYTGNKTEIIEGKPQVRVGIQLDYSPHAINQLLRDAQLPLWPSPRPEILLWPVYQDSNGLQRVLDEESLQQLQRQAYLRGIKIKLPELDLEDDLALSREDLWNLQFEKIQAASARYKADLVAVVRYQPQSMGVLPQPQLQNAFSDGINETEFSDSSSSASSELTNDSSLMDASSSLAVPQGPWVIEWQILGGQQPVVKQEQTDLLAPVFKSFVDFLADDLSSRYSIAFGQASINTCYLHIGRVNDFAAMKKSQAYLKSLAMVQKAEIIKVNQEGLLMSLTIEGDARLLASTLLLGQRLLPEFNDSMTPPAEQIAFQDTAIEGDNRQTITGEANNVEPLAPAAMPALTCTASEPLRYLWQQ